MQQHVVPVRVYLSVFVALLALLALTVWVAYVKLGPVSLFIAMTVAVVKALLVILYFMHVRHSTRLTWLFAGAGFFWLFIMIGLMLSDYVSRAHGLSPGA